jgi:nucleotide-binding universal stress UspA family protein
VIGGNADRACSVLGVSRTVLVGYDDTPPARRALERAAEEAGRGGDRIAVLAVLETPVDPDAPRNFGTAGDFSDEPQVAVVPDGVQEVLAAARNRLGSAGDGADYLWAAGDPSVRIVSAARELHARLVVLGAHHHSLLGRLFGADVTEEVRRRAGCEVIVVD